MNSSHLRLSFISRDATGKPTIISYKCLPEPCHEDGLFEFQVLVEGIRSANFPIHCPVCGTCKLVFEKSAQEQLNTLIANMLREIKSHNHAPPSNARFRITSQYHRIKEVHHENDTAPDPQPAKDPAPCAHPFTPPLCIHFPYADGHYWLRRFNCFFCVTLGSLRKMVQDTGYNEQVKVFFFMLRDRPGTGVTLDAKADEEILKEYLEHYYQELKSTWGSRRYKKVVVSYGNIHKTHDYMSPEWLYMVPALLADTGNANEMEAHGGTKRAAQYISQGSLPEDIE